MERLAALLLALLSAAVAHADCIEGDCVDGNGRMIYDDGSSYLGEWQDGMPNGQDLLTNPDNSTKEGPWKDGQFIGAEDRD